MFQLATTTLGKNQVVVKLLWGKRFKKQSQGIPHLRVCIVKNRSETKLCLCFRCCLLIINVLFQHLMILEMCAFIFADAFSKRHNEKTTWARSSSDRLRATRSCALVRLESDAAALTARPLHVQQTMRVRWQPQSFFFFQSPTFADVAASVRRVWRRR